jgi:hypothetical protein
VVWKFDWTPFLRKRVFMFFDYQKVKKVGKYTFYNEIEAKDIK